MIHMKHQMLEALQPFFFKHMFDKKKGHNIFALMLDPRFKNMWLVANYCGCELAFVLVNEYDVGLPLLVKCYKTS